MTDADALIAAICAEPKEDTPRLAYADYLDEHAEEVECGACKGWGVKGPTVADMPEIRERVGLDGRIEQFYVPKPFDARGAPACPTCSGTGRVSNGNADHAEFIRVQCELARGCSICEYGDYLSKRVKQGRCPWCATAIRRMNELLAAHQREWFHIDGLSGVGFGENEPLCWWPAGDSRGEPKPRIEGTPIRGFVSALTCSWEAWRTHAAAIRKAQPVERVRLTTHPNGWLGLIEDQIEALERRYPGIAFELPSPREAWDIDPSPLTTGTH